MVRASVGGFLIFGSVVLVPDEVKMIVLSSAQKYSLALIGYSNSLHLTRLLVGSG
jgi:hypothetical protein